MFVPVNAYHSASISYVALCSDPASDLPAERGEASAEYRRGTGEIAEAIRKASGDICFWLFMIWAINTALQATGII